MRARWIGVVLASGAICVVSLLYWCKNMNTQTDLVPYTPVVRQVDRGDHVLVDAPGLLTEAHVKAMTNVLARYGERYDTHGATLRIERKLAEDRDLLANYTEKAKESLAP